MTAPDRMFRAFADQTRLRILNLLGHGKELCVLDIHEILGLRQPKISRHLAYLRNAGLVDVRREGRWKHYSLVAPRRGFHRGLLECLRGCSAEVGILRKDLKSLRGLQARKTTGQ